MKQAYVTVSVASIWTEPNLPREIDLPATTNPVDIPSWLSNLTLEDKLWFIDENILQTQALYGTPVWITDERDGWSQILVPDQYTPKHEKGYPGWIPTVQLTVNPSFAAWDLNPSVWVTVPKTLLQYKDQSLTLSYMTRLPLIREEGNHIIVALPTGGEGRLNASDVTIRSVPHQVEKPYLQAPYPMLEKRGGFDIVQAGKQFLDLPYLWSGMSSFGYDCSGFSYSMHKANGILIPRDASAQFKYGKDHGLEVKKEELELGDLLYFTNEKGNVSHVGIYAGEGQFLHAPNSKNAVTIQPLWEGKYGETFCGAIRYW